MFKKKVVVIVFLVILASCQSDKENKTSKNDKIEVLIKKMTLEEKVGQMTQLTLKKFYKKGELNKDLLIKYTQTTPIGSVLNTPGSPLSISEWHELISEIQDNCLASRMKIPMLYGIDAIHGATYTKDAVLFPHNIGLAATRNLELVKKTAEITAKEVRASGIRWNFDPVLGVGRQPLWSRFEETFGEDVLLVTEFGSGAIKGYEGDDLKSINNVSSCMKHFIGYSVPQSGKDRTPAYITEQQLEEVFMPSFKKAVASGASTVMINSGSLNGIPVHINKELITDLLKNKWGFKGLVVTDWEDILYLYEEHHVAKDNKEAVKMAVNAGIDMSMVPMNMTFYDDLIALVNQGEVSMERIDDAVRRILKVKMDLGLFDNPYPEKEAIKNFGKKEYKEIALQAARESMTLLKNDSLQNKAVLPLKKNSKVLISGPASNSLASLHGSWSYSWQGDKEALFPESTLTIKEAIQNKIGASNVSCISSSKFEKVTKKELKLLRQKAKNVDFIVLCLGENSYAETPGNIDDLTLSRDQIELAKVAIETNKPIVLVLTEGRPRIISEIVSGIDAVLLAYRPSSQGANAIADVLFGDYNPNGVLPFSYPKHTGSLLTYDAPIRNKETFNPQWEFGYGLSYTNFKSSNLKLSTKALKGDEKLKVTIEVMNEGDFDGELAIDLFVRDKVASVIPAMKKLKKFKKVFLKKGAMKVVAFELTKSDLSFVNSNLKRVTENGSFEIEILGEKVSFEYLNN
ncbi:glycoside hydrolase family 3 C-terminal domain-containing protein [Polaribacter sp. Z014]|uniref:glycoside hydrolase family 3 N-terminal domain-containing protein n=1 Tax=Polaribacter sp. Z014 TaxID=2927126 RepID=UPI00202282FC|nr:glycoside hydrolase family 3 N-terminal domain-containing protein [Polaribacter sp. Z014]MCL7762556.1 glycoside hydrolase family 3 C-terminal domain-containing protein [Polaribacter sp. Z014]